MSFATWFFDYDNDGALDLFVANYVPSVTEIARGFLGLPPEAETTRLYRNTGRGGFEDVTAAAGVARVTQAMGANFGDIDNDGFLDIYLGTGAPSYASIVPNVLLRNDGGRRYLDVTTASGTGHLQKGHGVGFGDLDGDGAEDLVVNIGGFVPGDAYWKAVFRNPGTTNHWLDVRLVGVRSNRVGIGASIDAWMRERRRRAVASPRGRLERWIVRRRIADPARRARGGAAGRAPRGHLAGDRPPPGAHERRRRPED